MTNSVQVANERPRSSRVRALDALKHFQLFASWLHDAARIVQRNYFYYFYDVISGAFRTLGIAWMVGHLPERDHEHLDFMEDIRRFFGPHSVRQALGMLRGTDYSLPLGTQYELLKRKEHLTQGLTQQGRMLVGNLEQALKADNPIEYVTRLSGTQPEDWLWNELERLEPLHNEMALLGEIRDHAIPFDALLKEMPNDLRVASPAYRLALSTLQAERPNPDRSNQCDAMNVALLVGLFRQARERRKRVPILISQTQALVGLNARQRALALPVETEIHVFNDYLYLVLSQTLTVMSGGRHQLISQHAGVLAQAIEHVQELIRKALIRVEFKNELGGPEWAMLRNAWRSFAQEWQHVLRPLDWINLDRTSFRNALSTRQVHEFLGRMKPGSDVQGALVQLERYLGLSSERERELLALLAYDSVEPEDDVIELECRVLSHATACGELISDATGGTPLSDFECPSDVRSIRVTAAVPACPWLVLFVVDWLETGLISIGWCHDCDNHAVAATLVALGGLFVPPGQDEPCEIDLYSERRGHAVVSLQDAEQVLFEGLAPNTVPYVEVAVGSYAAFCDIEPIEGRERQMGIIGTQAEISSMSSAVRDRLAEYLAQSNMRPTLRESCQLALSLIMDRLPKLFQERST
jgi:hypothetical protein